MPNKSHCQSLVGKADYYLKTKDGEKDSMAIPHIFIYLYIYSFLIREMVVLLLQNVFESLQNKSWSCFF